MRRAWFFLFLLSPAVQAATAFNPNASLDVRQSSITVKVPLVFPGASSGYVLTVGTGGVAAMQPPSFASVGTPIVGALTGQAFFSDQTSPDPLLTQEALFYNAHDNIFSFGDPYTGPSTTTLMVDGNFWAAGTITAISSAVVGGFRMNNGGSTGDVLTRDASGYGLWQTPSTGTALAIGASVSGAVAGFPFYAGTGGTLQQSVALYESTSTGNIGVWLTGTPQASLDIGAHSGSTYALLVSSFDYTPLFDVKTNGNVIVPSTMTVGYFEMPIGGSNGDVLTRDASGYGTWQTPVGGGLTVGDSVTGGAGNRILFEDANQELATDSFLQFSTTTKVLYTYMLQAGDMSASNGAYLSESGNTFSSPGGNIFSSSVSVTGPGLTVNYGITAATMTLTGATGVGYVLTDTAGDGHLSMQPPTDSGSSVYPATATATFPYGFSASTAAFSSGITASAITAVGSTINFNVDGATELQVSSGIYGKQILVAQNPNTSYPDIACASDPRGGLRLYGGCIDVFLNASLAYELCSTHFRTHIPGTAADPSIGGGNIYNNDTGLYWLQEGGHLYTSVDGVQQLDVNTSSSVFRNNVVVGNTLSTLNNITAVYGVTSATGSFTTNVYSPFFKTATSYNSGIMGYGTGRTFYIEAEGTPIVDIDYNTKGGFVMAIAGSATYPTLALVDTANGFYRPAANNVALTTNGTERWRTNASGYTAFGGTSPTEKLSIYGTGTAYALSVATSTTANISLGVKNDGTVYFGNLGDGSLTVASGVLTSSSDERLKDVTGKFCRGLKDVLSINPILYRWNKKSGINAKPIYAGFSAQNVKKTIPEAVSLAPDGTYSLSDRPIIAALVNAVKELSAEVDELKARINTAAAGKTRIISSDPVVK